ncbi:helix-turn-helix transcriptional regulator [Marinobacter sp. M-5]|uniref:helix-turn-helix transcriptional regulator n=1 Tax=Marinobacter sp. M-5 TaxID=3081089 RepID=UPI00293C2435|nr:LuxR C-terminal-related transcriptional regulator [Marinobacter sp. M-5]MDV3505416.1 LuxR C-terminal-related transcriptional regulator [Marinobacter sp. M-5]
MPELDSTATALRAAYRAAGLSERHLQCLQSCIQLMQSPRDDDQQKLLATIADHFGAPHAVLLSYQSGRLRALESLGGAAITASRQPVRAALAPFLKWPCKPFVRHTPEKAWLFYSLDPGFEWLIPIILRGRVVGVLAMAGYADQPAPGERDHQLMTILSALLAGRIGHEKPQPATSARAQSHDLGLLSPREKEVMSLLPRGMSNSRIATTLGIAPGTVKTHVERILNKLQLEDRSHAAARAVELNLGNSGL